MKIFWYADWDGDLREVDELTEVLEDIGDEVGYEVDGPFYPQDAALLYILDAPRLQVMHRGGRRLLDEVVDRGLPVTPLRYEVAVTPEEFWSA